MIRVLFCLIAGVGLLALASVSLFHSLFHAEPPLAVPLLIAFFGAIFCFLAWVCFKHHLCLLRARKSEPVIAEVFVGAIPRRGSSDRLVAEISIGQDIWCGYLFGRRHEHALAGRSSQCWAWLDPQTGAPLELKVQGKIITPIPVVIKAKPGSKLENYSRANDPFDDLNRPPSLRR